MTRLLTICLLTLALSACGFHLRNALSLPTELGPVRVIASDPYSALAESLSQALERAGAVPAAADASTGVATLQVVSERWASTPLAIDQLGRAQEYTLRYAVIFKLTRADGSVAVPQQVIELSRDYVAPPNDSIGQSSQAELLARELRREMTASVLRRIEAVSRPSGNAVTQ